MATSIGGYVGKILRVNLTIGKISKEDLEDVFVKQYVGGLGTAARILYDEVPPWVGDFDPENRLIFATGPMTGTIVPAAGRHTVVTKSPMTGLFGDANAGGTWGAELKFSGYDMIVISGKATNPVFLWINDGNVEIKDAQIYWGKNARETDRIIRSDLGEKDAKVACIGRAGENLVRMAAIVNDEADRIAARCGVGAVMGSKNLKAIALRGHNKVPISKSDILKGVSTDVTKFIATNENMRDFHKRGTPRNFEPQFVMGDASAYNWSKADFEGAGRLAIPGGYEKILVNTRTCYVCPIGCRRVVSLTEGPYSFEKGAEGPEYETLVMLGSSCGCDSIEAVAKANDLCNLYGLDTISTGSTIAFSMECFEKELLSTEETDGIKLKFGNCDVIIQMIHKIANREGFGNILAEGTRRAARIIGKGSENYAIQVKGLELPAHDPRAWRGGPYYATVPSGGKHTEGMPIGWHLGVQPLALEIGAPRVSDKTTDEDECLTTRLLQDWFNFVVASGWCMFPTEFGGYPSAEDFTKMYSAVTGIQISINDALRLGERIFTLRRCFSMRHGATKEDDTLPRRLTTERNTKSGVIIELDRKMPHYYKIRGWDQTTAIPIMEKLHELGLQDIRIDLHQK